MPWESTRGSKGEGGYAITLSLNGFIMSIDFLAFAPELFLIAIGFSPPSWLRALRVVRIFKMARYFRAFKLVCRRPAILLARTSSRARGKQSYSGI